MRAPPLHPPPDRVLRSLSGFGAHDHREGRMMRPSRGPADCGPLRIHGSRWRLVGGRVTGREPARGVARPCRQTCGRVGWCYLPTAPGDGPPPLISPLAHGGPSQALVCTTRPLWGPADGGPFRTHGSMQVWWGGRPRGGWAGRGVRRGGVLGGCLCRAPRGLALRTRWSAANRRRQRGGPAAAAITTADVSSARCAVLRRVAVGLEGHRGGQGVKDDCP